VKTNNREILIYYNQGSSSDRKTIAHAKAVSQHIRSYDFKSAPSTDTSWQMILKSLNIHPKDLMDKSKPYYRANIKGKDFDKEGWLKVLRRHPDLIKAPIAIRGNRAVLCINPTDIYQLNG